MELYILVFIFDKRVWNKGLGKQSYLNINITTTDPQNHNTNDES